MTEKVKFILPKNKISSDVDFSDRDFKAVLKLIYDHAGITIDEQKKVMVTTRLTRRVNRLKLDSIAEYLKYLKESKEELVNFINALTTNKTNFFRENEHFEYMKKEILPNVSGKDTFYVWSAAASTGEEIYTLGMVLDEAFKNTKKSYKVLGTDIDTEVLQKADNGIYGKEVREQIPPYMVSKYFLAGKGTNKNLFKVGPNIKNHVKFRRHNLVNQGDRLDIQFDVIFLRNVLIYFSSDTIQIVISKLVSHLKSGGYLFIGHSETLGGIKHDLQSVAPAVYRKK